nr:hypothetical protein CFP56_16481 [Quercus suber]
MQGRPKGRVPVAKWNWRKGKVSVPGHREPRKFPCETPACALTKLFSSAKGGTHETSDRRMRSLASANYRVVMVGVCGREAARRSTKVGIDRSTNGTVGDGNRQLPWDPAAVQASPASSPLRGSTAQPRDGRWVKRQVGWTPDRHPTDSSRRCVPPSSALFDTSVILIEPSVGHFQWLAVDRHPFNSIVLLLRLRLRTLRCARPSCSR